MDVVLDSLQRIFDTNDVIIIISNDGFDQYYYDQWFEIQFYYQYFENSLYDKYLFNRCSFEVRDKMEA